MFFIRCAIFSALFAICFCQDASVLCFQHRDRRNAKDLYADPTDCHFYYQCFYHNSTFAEGIRRQCPAGQFWHDPVVTCMPEGAKKCVDRCLEDDVSAKGCYAGTGCSQYYVCSNTGSYGMCCPGNTSFNLTTCGCDISEPKCGDACVQEAPLNTTTVKPSSQFNATVCQDSYDVFISIVPGEVNAFWILTAEGWATEKRYCPKYLAFDLTTCRCNNDTRVNITDEPITRKATLWLPFDTDAKDKSVINFATFLYDGAQFDSAVSAVGTGGSLAINGGYLSIPGLKSYDTRNAGSWCAFYRCEPGTGYACSADGGILSNNKNNASTEFTAIMGVNGTNRFIGMLHFWHPVGIQVVGAPVTVPANGWNHFCVTYDSNTVRLYLNGAIADTQFVGGFLSIASGPYLLGTDAALGTFNGHIDDVLMTSFAMTKEEVNAHRTGDRAFLVGKGFF